MEIVEVEGVKRALAATDLSAWAETLDATVEAKFAPGRHGDLPRWRDALVALPKDKAGTLSVESGTIVVGQALTDIAIEQQLEISLKTLLPWRKGPFRFSGIDVDAEWRSDQKWSRVSPHLSALRDRTVLDVGSGNGYYAMRMVHDGARFVIGIDPTLTAVMQFAAARHFWIAPRASILPIGIEDVPRCGACFDTVFSMGVLYHRRDHLDHLRHLFSLMRPGGELVLETLVIDGDQLSVLIPDDRYARMRNVWALGSVAATKSWLRSVGFSNVRVVDVTVTTVEEQRTTEWMPFQSLRECLSADEPNLTIEGYPRPTRATFIATK